MIQTINQSMFIDAFRSMGRENQFSYGALVALFEYLEDVVEELDVVGLCCEFTEYATLEDYNYDYNGDTHTETMEDLEQKTLVIHIGQTESFIIQQF